MRNKVKVTLGVSLEIHSKKELKKTFYDVEVLKELCQKDGIFEIC